MAKELSLQCSHGGLVCRERVTGATEDEVVQKAVEHARQVHGVDLTQAQTLARYARSLVRETGDA